MATLNIKNFPADLYERLKERAARDHRSMAQEVTWLLERALAEPEPLSLLEMEGLGKEIWEETDAAGHVSRERDSWD